MLNAYTILQLLTSNNRVTEVLSPRVFHVSARELLVPILGSLQTPAVFVLSLTASAGPCHYQTAIVRQRMKEGSVRLLKTMLFIAILIVVAQPIFARCRDCNDANVCAPVLYVGTEGCTYDSGGDCVIAGVYCFGFVDEPADVQYVVASVSVTHALPSPAGERQLTRIAHNLPHQTKSRE